MAIFLQVLFSDINAYEVNTDSVEMKFIHIALNMIYQPFSMVPLQMEVPIPLLVNYSSQLSHCDIWPFHVYVNSLNGYHHIGYWVYLFRT